MVNNSTNIKQTTTIISHLKSLNIIKKKQQERHINVARSNQLAGGQTSQLEPNPSLLIGRLLILVRKIIKLLDIRFSGHDAFQIEMSINYIKQLTCIHSNRYLRFHYIYGNTHIYCSLKYGKMKMQFYCSTKANNAVNMEGNDSRISLHIHATYLMVRACAHSLNFTFNGDNCLQMNEIAMETKMAPPYANKYRLR